MDKLQNTFTTSYVAKLANEVKAEISIDKYSAEEFEYDKSALKFVARVYKPDNLLEQMLSAENDFEAAVFLYKAYKDIPLVLASNEAFWTYLCHVDLFEYCKKRYPVNEAKNKISHIQDHWFFGKGHTRNTLAQLWWGVHETIDEDNPEDPYHLTKVFFINYSFRVIWLTVMLRTKQGLLGILDFLKENPEITDKAFEYRGLFIAKYFNRLGGSKQLSSLPRDFFKKELDKIKDTILSITSKAQVSNVDASNIIQQARLDKTKYSLNDSVPLSKGKLAVMIVKEYVKKYPQATFDEIQQKFPDVLIPSSYRSLGLIVKAEIVANSELLPKYKNKRYYYDTKDFWLKSSDGIEFLVNNQWDINSIGDIIDVGISEGFSIVAIEN
ncbi:MAG: hypothetical protein IKZ14_03565 [Muribaculaceae bacterium]|nr:hypothetical protein [Muribaculaceae bacterium]